MRKYPYLLYIGNNNFINNDYISELNNSEELHILNLKLNNVPNINHNNCYLYVFNNQQYYLAKSKNWKYHIALYGEDIFNDELINLATNNTEIFWFPTNEQIISDTQAFVNRLKTINKSICINFNPYIQNDITAENFRIFVKTIHESFINPVISKELELLENTYENTEDYNFVLIEKNNQIVIQPLVLGLFGDYPIKSLENYSLINKKKILKTKDCMGCDFNEYCINRGIGYIMDQLQYKGCISIKLLQP